MGQVYTEQNLGVGRLRAESEVRVIILRRKLVQESQAIH
jgi:hypothetical protein